MKLRTLIRVAQAMRTPEPAGDQSGQDSPSQDPVRGVAGALRRDARVQQVTSGLRDRARDWRSAASARADEHLERLIQDSHARRGSEASGQVTALLEARRQEREAQARAEQARRELMARANTPEQRRILDLVASHTSWAGGTAPQELRYTALLDLLAPSGRPADEMAVHRALWTLAEQRVLAVSPHGVVTACEPPVARAVLSLPASTAAEPTGF
ncbi:hypothetical protein DEDE109153_05925 [Deinococcus deserti]|uniref:Uncharacterized protein n=1 Tax=Deinococcus deserti (strain DSM 17065 / CIP 109153 / LMG 22923 / VCD115) TaxID=546414 RepID=C1CYU7_DEIDV|nr:hypothetical protein [Deinococcus deserti]ACO47127.1 hypothetical protein Deide_21020 [Deinococcus deserti VCD115]